MRSHNYHRLAAHLIIATNHHIRRALRVVAAYGCLTRLKTAGHGRHDRPCAPAKHAFRPIPTGFSRNSRWCRWRKNRRSNWGCSRRSNTWNRWRATTRCTRRHATKIQQHSSWSVVIILLLRRRWQWWGEWLVMRHRWFGRCGGSYALWVLQ